MLFSLHRLRLWRLLEILQMNLVLRLLFPLNLLKIYPHRPHFILNSTSKVNYRVLWISLPRLERAVAPSTGPLQEAEIITINHLRWPNLTGECDSVRVGMLVIWRHTHSLIFVVVSKATLVNDWGTMRAAPSKLSSISETSSNARSSPLVHIHLPLYPSIVFYSHLVSFFFFFFLTFSLLSSVFTM